MKPKHNRDMYPCTMQLKGSLWYHNKTLSTYVHFNLREGNHMLFNMASNAMLNDSTIITFAGPDWTGEEVVMT